MVRDLKHARTAPDPSRWMRMRVLIVCGVFLTLLLGVFTRAVQLQVQQRDQLKGMAQDQYVRQIEIPARRGDVLDRRGVPLAQSVDVDSIWIDPSMLQDQKLAARMLARSLDLDTDDLFARFTKAKRFAWVKRQVTPAEVAKVNALNLPGIGLTKEPRRFYPQRELAAHVLGLVGTDGHGLDGLELSFEDELSGDAVTQPALRDARGRKLNTVGSADPIAREGATLTVTLDRQIQWLTEKALVKAVTDAKAIAGMAVVLDPRTGEILALANAPRFNPNAPQDAKKDAFRNRAVSDAFEPGSTFKAFVVSAALEEKLVTESTTFDTNGGAWTVGKNVIHDTHPHGTIDTKTVLQVSSNIGAAKIAGLLGREKLQSYYSKFGLGEKPGMGLPGEAKGQVPFPKAEVQLATQAFGQGVSASAVQVAAAYGALANGGVLMKPYLVSKVVDPDGVVLLDNKPTPVRRVVSEKSARRTIAMLESVVEKEGTAPRARLDEYRVAGKTGTAQKPDPVSRGYSEKRIGSFIGVVPAEDPRLVIYIVIDEPETDPYGGIIAAPAFKEIATAALPYLSVPPSKNMPPPPAQTVAKTATTLDKPEKPAPAPPAGLAAAFAKAQENVTEEAPVVVGSVRVPDLRGRAGREAVTQLLAAALEPRLEGSGWVTGQRPAAGSLVEKGSRVTLELAGTLPLTTR